LLNNYYKDRLFHIKKIDIKEELSNTKSNNKNIQINKILGLIRIIYTKILL